MRDRRPVPVDSARELACLVCAGDERVVIDEIAGACHHSIHRVTFAKGASVGDLVDFKQWEIGKGTDVYCASSHWHQVAGRCEAAVRSRGFTNEGFITFA
jgi:hypothetical protein